MLLALIGPEWLDAKDSTGSRRLDDPTDFVRLETAAALRRDIPVVPILVRGAKMPRPEQLPEDLKDLAYRNGAELTHARWSSDVEILVKDLKQLNIGVEWDAPGGAANQVGFDSQGTLWVLLGSTGAPKDLIYLLPGNRQFKTAGRNLSAEGFTWDVNRSARRIFPGTSGGQWDRAAQRGGAPPVVGIRDGEESLRARSAQLASGEHKQHC